MLIPVDIRKLSGVASCTQDIASTGAFSVSMVSVFESLVNEHPHHYRRSGSCNVEGVQYQFTSTQNFRMFWEAGMIGQLLYLESEVRVCLHFT